MPVVGVGTLVVKRDGADDVLVPLYPAGQVGPELSVEPGVVLWEDQPARLSCTVASSGRMRSATLSVNDHGGLACWRESEWHPGEDLWHHVLTPDETRANDAQPRDYQYPFQLTCGFARVRLRLAFEDGSEEWLGSRDLVCLDEPRPGVRGERDRAEEGNVSAMYDALTGPSQAAEWMFSRADASRGWDLPADDDFTDWAHESVARLLDAASETLDLVHDGLDDPSDAFPNAGKAGFDTSENRAVRALLRTVGEKLAEAKGALESSKDQVGRTIQELGDLLLEKLGEGHEATLPALALLREQRDAEEAWLARCDDLVWRVGEALKGFDEATRAEVAEEDFGLPRRRGLWKGDATYARLHAAMEAWRQHRRADVTTAMPLLHAIKPDRLFEYYALWRMLGWFYGRGFRENQLAPRPVGWYAYRAEAVGGPYTNEWRCANTYRLAREGGAEVDLYFQPVLYADGEENELPLRRVGGDDGAFWTPDYLLVLRDAEGERVVVLDAKYRPWDALVGGDGELAACLDKYLARCAVPGGGAGEGVAGVWVLCGHVEPAQAVASIGQPAGGLPPELATLAADRSCGVAPCSTATTDDEFDAFMEGLVGW